MILKVKNSLSKNRGFKSTQIRILFVINENKYITDKLTISS